MTTGSGPECHAYGIKGYGLQQQGGVCFIGIAPGQDEAFKSHRPLTGPSGQLLDACLDACKWSRDKVYTTNLLCWWNNAPTVDEIFGCWQRLKSELQQLKPKLIIPLGEIATDFLLGNLPTGIKHTPSDWNTYAWSHLTQWPEGEEYFGFSSRRGRTTWSSHLQAYVMPTYHPAAVLRRGPYFIADIARDLQKIPLILREFRSDGREADYDYEVVHSVEQGQRILDSLPRGITRTSAGVSLDIETNYGREDIDWYSEDLLCLSLTWEWNTTRVIPGGIAKQLDWSSTKSNRFGNSDSGIHWIGQNFIFDSGGIRRWCSGPNSGGIVDLPIHEDTMYESYALDERPGRHRLEVLGGEWCAASMWKSALAKYDGYRIEVNENGRKVRRKYRNVPMDALYRYNAGDTTYTYRSHVRQMPYVVEDGMERVYRTLLIPAANAFKDIQYRGLNVDQYRQSELMVEWCQIWLDQEAELQRIAHEEDPQLLPKEKLNFNSPQQMMRFLYDVLRLPKQYTRSTKKSEPPKLTTNKQALEALYQYHPFCQLLHDFRQTEHAITVSTGISNRIKIDGMLHAQPQIHGTETGRLSYHDPNLQNISQDWSVGANLARIREVFAPVNPETHLIAEADYKQIELWMAWRWSLDPNMKADLDTGDFHRMTSMGVYNKTWEEVTRGDRFFSKIITFGRLYERGAEDMLKGKHGIEGGIEAAYEFIRKWEQRYAGYVQWAKDLKNQAINEGIITTPWGRKRRYYLVIGEEAHHMLRSALNFCMQSTAHDYTLSALIELHNSGALARYDSYILVENHDALLLEIAKKYWREVQQLVTDVMQSVRPDPTWPTLTVEWKTGQNWGECHTECDTCKLFYPEVNVQEISISPTVIVTRCTSCQRQVQRAA